MAKIRIRKSQINDPMARLEHEADVMNRQFDIQRSIDSRTMTKPAYYKLHHELRTFFWRVKNNFIPVQGRSDKELALNG
jgi:hypothetical protein